MLIFGHVSAAIPVIMFNSENKECDNHWPAQAG